MKPKAEEQLRWLGIAAVGLIIALGAFAVINDLPQEERLAVIGLQVVVVVVSVLLGELILTRQKVELCSGEST